jgi:hypothetical protein
MNKSAQLFGLLMLAVIFIALSCNETEPEAIVIQADIPEFVMLRDTFSIADTFRFNIESKETTIATVSLYEDKVQHISIGTNEFGGDKLKLELHFIYNPNAPGIKNFELIVQAPPFEKKLPFSVEVIQ